MTKLLLEVWDHNFIFAFLLIFYVRKAICNRLSKAGFINSRSGLLFTFIKFTILNNIDRSKMLGIRYRRTLYAGLIC